MRMRFPIKVLQSLQSPLHSAFQALSTLLFHLLHIVRPDFALDFALPTGSATFELTRLTQSNAQVSAAGLRATTRGPDTIAQGLMCLIS